ncbi:MAG: ATPase [Bryobacterales bacterium]|nr:ATPase [Bryobacterales bacterium]
MAWFLGVDGGQSSTKAVLGDDSGTIVGMGVGGPCNHVRGPGGREKLVSAVTDCVGKACAEAGLNPRGIRYRAACFGMSGGPADKREILAELLPADELIVTHDAMIALAGATAGEPGIIAIAGTGSIAFGRNAASRTARVGGWGYVFGDEGGGFDLTRQALRAALRYHEGWGPATALHDRLLAATGATDANDLLHRFYTEDYPRPRIAALSSLVDEAARDGDPVARDLLQHAAQQLATLAGAVRRQLWAEDEGTRVVYAGGVFQSEILLERFRMLVELNGSSCRPPRLDAATGALIEAYRAAGIQPQGW